jgi:hypothetical protein
MNLAQVILASTSSGGNGSFTPPSPGSNNPPNSAGVTYPSQGTPGDPGAGQGTPSPATTGLIRRAYLGQWSTNGQDNNPSIFSGSPFDTTPDSYMAFGSQSTGDNYCMEWKGFFKANATANWNFRVDADDVVMFWIGSAAYSPNNSNWTCSSQTNSGLNFNSVSLTQDTWYPIRIRYQEWGGAESLNIYGSPAGNDMSALYNYGWANFMYVINTDGY